MRSASKLSSSQSLPRPSLANAGLLFSRYKSSRRRPPSASSPSLYKIFADIIPVDVRSNNHEETNRTQSVRQNVRDSQTVETGKSPPEVVNLEEISGVVHKVTEIIRAENTHRIPMEKRLAELGIPFTTEIVEKVLKRCFKVGNLALRFFNWMKLQPGFSHTTETYNTMAYITGEAGEFELLEKLMEEMDADLCVKDIKTWTILISQYANAKKIGKALSTFEKMRISGCKLDNGVYEALLRGLLSARKPKSALIRGYMNMGMFSDAWNIFHLMKVKGPFPDFESYSMFMTRLCKEGRSEDAFKLIQDMLESQIIPSAINFRTVYFGLNRDGKQELARLVLQMKWKLKRERMHSIGYHPQLL